MREQNERRVFIRNAKDYLFHKRSLTVNEMVFISSPEDKERYREEQNARRDFLRTHLQRSEAD